jgi:hypothetical protein
MDSAIDSVVKVYHKSFQKLEPSSRSAMAFSQDMQHLLSLKLNEMKPPSLGVIAIILTLGVSENLLGARRDEFNGRMLTGPVVSRLDHC